MTSEGSGESYAAKRLHMSRYLRFVTAKSLPNPFFWNFSFNASLDFACDKGCRPPCVNVLLDVKTWLDVQALTQLHTSETLAEDTYKVVIQKYPKSVKILRAYVRFLREIKNDPWKAQRYDLQADNYEQVSPTAVQLTVFVYDTCSTYARGSSAGVWS